MAPSGEDMGVPGRRVPDLIEGRYRVNRLIGRGGQGDVYLAHDENLAIDVAVKVLHAEYREQFIERFTQEARTIARLSLTNANIVRIFDFNPNYPYLVMEYCGDGDLNQMIKSRRPQTLPRTVSLIQQICSALVTAHEQAKPIVHRDLKPANVLFQQEVPKVADFGLAKALTDASSGFTKTHGMMGTIGYASPEQLKDASRVDHRTDLWAVGVILYELLTFRPPFEKPGDDFVNVAIKVRTEPPADPPFEIPEPLWKVVERSLAKEPMERFASARELVQALDQVLAFVPNSAQLSFPPPESLGEIDIMASRVADSLDSGSSEEARSLVEHMRQISPDDSLVRYWDRRLREVSEESARSDSSAVETRTTDTRYRNIEELIDKHDYAQARRECGKLLIERTGDARAAKLRQRITEEEAALNRFLDQVRQDAERARASRDLQKVLEVWQGVDEAYADHPEVRAELAFIVNEIEAETRARDRAMAEQEAQRFEQAGQLRSAVTVWTGYLDKHPGDAEAVSRKRAIEGRLAAETKSERRKALIEESAELQREGRLDPALAVLDLWLEETPGDEEVVRRAETLRVEIADRRMASLLETARDDAERQLQRDDVGAALEVWRGVLEQHPTQDEARREVERLERALEEGQKAELSGELRRLVERLEARVKAGRYGSLDAIGKSLDRALSSARQDLDGGLPALQSARQALIEASDAAEGTLGRSLAERRTELRGRIGTAAEHFEADSVGETGEALRHVWEEAVASLGEASAPDGSGDPLEKLSRAGEALGRAVEALEAERRATIEGSRTRAGEALRRAETAVGALRGVPDLPGAATNLEQLSGRLEEIRAQRGSASEARLERAARAASVLAAEAESSRVSAIAHLQQQLRGAIDGALQVAPGATGDRLPTLLGTAVQLLESGSDGALDPSPMVGARDELSAESASCRQRLQEASAQAEKHWARVADLAAPPELADRMDEIRRAGAAALESRRFEEVRRCATRLENLGRRGRLEATWGKHRAALLDLEGPADGDGVVAGPSDAAEQEALARYREAIAAGDTETAGALGERLARQVGDETGERAEIPELSGQARKINERYRPEVLERFDRAVAGHEHTEAERSHALLLQPAASRRWVVPVVIAAAAGLLVAVWTVRPGVEPAHVITLVSPTGAIAVQQVTRGGSAWQPPGDSARTITEDGVAWTLESGDYVVTTADGVEVAFNVPRDRSVLIPGPKTDYPGALMEELDLESLMGGGVP